MLTHQGLVEAFQLYVEELGALSVTRAYWGALHLICALPAVCAELEATHHTSDGDRYRTWCARHLLVDQAVFEPRDWYKMRCALFHEGSSLPTDPRGQASRYSSISFVTPMSAAPLAHRRVSNHHDGLNITLDVAALAGEILVALTSWFDWLLQPANAAAASAVESRLRSVISPRPKYYEGDEQSNRFITWSSTGSTPIVSLDFHL